MGIGKVFKKLGGIGRAALKVGSRVPTPAAPYLGLALDVIGLVEESVGKGNGKLKAALARKLLLESIRAYEALKGRDLVDEERLANALGPVIDTLVEIVNDMDLWSKILPRSN